MSNVYSVSQVNGYIKSLFEKDGRLYNISVRGEISNCKIHYTGHIYLTVKDEASAMRAVMFKSAASKLAFVPENGMKIIATGRISVYERDGAYQMYIENMEPDGVGALYIAYEQLKEKLKGEGLFDECHKKPIPGFPQTIGVVTASTGAAVRDIIHILKRRYPYCRVLVYPVLVQGPGAPADIISAISYFNEEKAADVLIVGRGGGSIEDLWAFNDEGVARAIFASQIPVISAVGHETDFTIADFVSDLRAPTPSAAAEVAVPDRGELVKGIVSSGKRILYAFTNNIAKKRSYVEALYKRPVFASPMEVVNTKRQIVDSAFSSIEKSMLYILEQKKRGFFANSAKLQALSPLEVLNRGYSIATKGEKGIVKSVSDVSENEHIELRVSDGKIGCKVINTKEGE